MSKFNKTGRKALSVFMSVATVTWLIGAPLAASAAALTQAQIDSIIGLLNSFGADSTTVNNVRASLSGGTPTGGTGTGSGTSTGSCGFTRDLQVGVTAGEDVRCLQKYLNGAGHQIAASGAGSPGSESTSFGPLTKAAVIKWQKAAGVSPAAGYFGAKSRAAYNAMAGGTGTTPPPAGTTPPPAGTGTGLTVSSATQPQSGLAPTNAARVPFTKVTFTASNDGDVVVNSLTVERTGPALDSSFAGIVLLDESGTQVGLQKTLNSDHKAILTDSFTVKRGQSRTMTLAGNMSATIGAGNIAFLSLNAVNTSAVVNGSLPIVGAGHTMNSSLTIGTVTNQRGPSDPNNSPSKEVGTTGYTFSAVQVTAGSTEKVKLNSIRWNQSGSAGSGDLANIKTYVNGVAYPTTVSDDGKYYSSTFSDIILDKGESKEISIKGDVLGGSGRTIAFDLYRTTDLSVTGETFGYGITPPTSGTGFASTNPWYDASVVTVSNGSMTISKANSVTSQNVAINVTDQALGGVDVEVKGEPISVANMVFRLSMWSGNGASGSTQDITQIKLVSPTGAVVAGPVDIAASSPTVTFTDTVNFPIGMGTYKLVGKLGTDFTTSDTVAASTTAAEFTTVTGQVTGNSITPSGGSITGNTMTVKPAVVTISVSSSPVAQTVVAGGKFTFANYQFNATASGEDIKFTTVPLAYDTRGNTATNLTNCQLWDGTTSLTTGSNAVNPSAAASSTTFTFDNSLTIPKGTTKTLALSCNIVGGATGAYAWGYDSGASPSATGLTSSQSATITENDSNGQKMTLSSGGTLTVTEDVASSLTYRLVSPGTDTVLTRLKFHAANEAINLEKVALQLSPTSVTASSSPRDLVGNKVTLFNGSGTEIGTAEFSGTANTAVSTLVTPLAIPKDGDAYLVIKGTFAAIGVSGDATQGHFIKVDYDAATAADTNGKGVSSGTQINTSSASDTSSSGVRLFNAVPLVEEVTGTPADDSLVTGGDLYKFKVTANPAGTDGIQLYKVTFTVATTTAVVTDWKLYGPNGAVNATAANLTQTTGGTDKRLEILFDSTAADRLISAGASKTYVLRATVANGAVNTNTLTIQLIGDDAFPGSSQLVAAGTLLDTFGGTRAFMSDATAIDTGATADDNFIWSPQATTTVVAADNDWTNGFGVSTGSGNSTLTSDLTARSFNY